MAIDARMQSAYAYFCGQRNNGAAPAAYAPPPQPVYQQPQPVYQQPQPVYQQPQPVYQQPQPVYQQPQPVYSQDAYNGFNAQLQQLENAMRNAGQQVQQVFNNVGARVASVNQPAYYPPQPVYQPQPQVDQFNRAVQQGQYQAQRVAGDLQYNVQQMSNQFNQAMRGLQDSFSGRRY